MGKKQNVLKRALSLVLSAAVAVGGLTLASPQEVYAATVDHFTGEDYANHWGRSDMRAYMNNGLGTIAADGTVSGKNYKLDSTKSSDNTSGFAANFSDAEYARIEPVTIETNVLDKNVNAASTYTTTDKIWLPSANRGSDQVASWGTKDLSANSTYTSETSSNINRIIPISYWDYNYYSNYSWLRSPNYYNPAYSLEAGRGYSVDYNDVDYDIDLAVALKINLNSVIFSSAASAASIAAEGGAQKITISGSSYFGVKTQSKLPDYGMYLKTQDSTNFNASSLSLSGSNLSIGYTGGTVGKYATVIAYKNDDVTSETVSLAAAGKINSSSGTVTINVSGWGVSSLSGYTVQVWMEDGSTDSLASATLPQIFEGSTSLSKKSTATYTNKRVFALKANLQCSWGTLSSAKALVGSNPTNQKIYYGGKEFWIAGRETAANNGSISASGDIMCLYQAKSDQTIKFNSSTSDYIASNLPSFTTPTNLTATYGQTLADVSLASGGGAGTWTWKNTSTSVGALGTKKFTAVFTPTDTANYKTVEVDLEVTVSRAKLTASNFTYTPPSNLTYDGSTKTATVTGIGDITVNYYDSSGTKLEGAPTTVGTYTVKIDVAADTNYESATELSNNWTFTVTQATPSYTAPTNLTATYGQTLADVSLASGGGAGTWMWKNTSTSVGALGTKKFTAVFTPTDTANYKTVEVDLEVTVNKATPSYTAPTNLTATYGQTLADVSLASGGGAGTWTWKNTSTSVGALGTKKFTAVFTPTDTANYKTVEVDLEVTVSRAKLTASNFTYTPPSNLTYDGSTKTATVTGIGDITVNYYDSSGTKLEGAPTTVGTYTVKIDVAADTNYESATELSNNWTFTVTQATPSNPTEPIPEAVTYGTKLSDIDLGNGWEWENPDTIPTVANAGYPAYYEVADYTNFDWTNIDGYNEDTHRVERLISLTVEPMEMTNNTGASVTLDSSAHTYNGEKWAPSITVTYGEDTLTEGTDYEVTLPDDMTSVGVKQITIKFKGNYGGSKTANGEIVYLSAPDNSYTIGGNYTDIENGVVWIKSGEKATIIPTEGYTISDALTGSYTDELEISEEQDAQNIKIHLKNSSGQMTDAITVAEAVKIDSEAPTATISIKNNQWKGFLNWATFGYFFKDTVDIKIDAEDQESGIETVKYQLLDTKFEEISGSEEEKKAAIIDRLNQNEWTEYDQNSTESITKEAREKFVIYAKITDNAGNVTYASSDGMIIIYNDAGQEIKANYTKMSKNGTTVTVDLKGNDLKAVIPVSEGEESSNSLTEGKDYAISINSEGKSEITFKSSYLDELSEGNYKFKISYNPLGVEYGSESQGDAPEDIIVTINIAKATPGISVPEVESMTYDPRLTLGDIKLKNPSENLDGMWTWSDPDTVPTVDKDKYEATFTPSDTDNYNTVTKEISVTVNKATSTYTVPEDLTATYGEMLSDVTLPSGWAWDDDTQSVGNAGENKFSATFTPSDIDNYNTVTKEISVKVNKATPDVKVPEVESMTYDPRLTLGDIKLKNPSENLDGMWTWSDPDTVPTVDKNKYEATFTPSDTDNYNTVKMHLTVTVKPALAQKLEVPELPEIEYGTELSEIKLPEDWEWADETIKSEVGTKEYEICIKVDDKNYDWTSVDGYDPETHTVTKSIKLTVVVDKSEWGEKVINSGVVNYVTEDGTTSAEVTENGMIYLKEESDGTSAWYGIDNSDGVFEIGSRFWVKWLSKETNAEEWQKHYDAMDEEYKNAVDSGKLWIFLTGVTAPNETKYTNLDKDIKYYVEIGTDWDKEDINAIFVSSGLDEIVYVEYLSSVDYPEGKGEFAKLTLKHFSPYAVYDELTEEEKKALQEINNNQNSGNTQNPINAVETGDNKTPLILTGLAVLAAISGAANLGLKKKKRDE